jgi:hypothetical protein
VNQGDLATVIYLEVARRAAHLGIAPETAWRYFLRSYKLYIDFEESWNELQELLRGPNAGR